MKMHRVVRQVKNPFRGITKARDENGKIVYFMKRKSSVWKCKHCEAVNEEKKDGIPVRFCLTCGAVREADAT